jgi:hypothetical protein
MRRWLPFSAGTWLLPFLVLLDAASSNAQLSVSHRVTAPAGAQCTSKGNGPFEPYISKSMQNAAAKKRGAEPVVISAGGSIEGREFVSFDVKRGDFTLATELFRGVNIVLGSVHTPHLPELRS